MEGLELGRTELAGEQLVEFGRRLLQFGVDPSLIEQVTGLTLAQLK